MKAIYCGKIVTVTSDIIENGTIIVENGKINQIINGFVAPEGAETYDYKDCWVMPGLIDAHTHIGLRGEPWQASDSFFDDENEMTGPIQAHVRAIDAFNPHDFAISKAREGGLTTCFTGPGSVTEIIGPWPCNVIGGTGFAFKLKNENSVDKIAIPGTEQMKAALGTDVLRFYSKKGNSPMTRMGAASLMRETLRSAKLYEEKLGGEESGDDFRLNALLPVIRGQMKFRIHCHRSDDICTAVRIAEEFNLDYCLEHVTEAETVLPVLKKHDVFCVIGPILGKPNKMEVWNRTLTTAASLEQAGVSFCISDDAMSATKWLAYHAGICTAYGLPMKKAFESVTMEPARLLGIENRVGSIEVGKDADLAVFNGNPLCNLSKCKATMIDGTWEFIDE